MNIFQKIQLEIIRYTLRNSPQLAPKIEAMSVYAQDKSLHDLNFIMTINKQLIESSRSQLRQDLFVLDQLNFKKNGFFVEFGATNGIDLSNSYLLEKEYGWTGILAEPAKLWHKELLNNRKSIIDTRCVWKETGVKLDFNETESAELSTLCEYSNSDLHAEKRKKGKSYPVETITLTDLLTQHHAPRYIDYLSIDTEGSEYDILKNFSFEKYRFKIITCEHNYSSTRERIFELLSKNGYKRKFEHLSQFDDWYVDAA
jgi:FkbM family methyltransferase